MRRTCNATLQLRDTSMIYRGLYIVKHLRREDEMRERTSSWIAKLNSTNWPQRLKWLDFFLNPTHIFSLGWGLCGFHGKFMWDTRSSRCPQMTFSCVSFCRNILALWSVPRSKPGIEHTPGGCLWSSDSVWKWPDEWGIPGRPRWCRHSRMTFLSSKV